MSKTSVWEDARENPNYGTWKYAVENGDTLRGFEDWLRHEGHLLAKPVDLHTVCGGEIGYDAYVDSNEQMNGGPFDDRQCMKCGEEPGRDEVYSASQAPEAPDDWWVDDKTGEYINAESNQRMPAEEARKIIEATK